jgi:predicted phosphodiesterase
MVKQKVTDEEFIRVWMRHKSPSLVAKELGMSPRGVYDRRIVIERKHGVALDTENDTRFTRPRNEVPKHGFRAIKQNIKGCVIIASDGHFWPGERSTAFGAMITLIKELKPSMVIMNGDSFDGARISRHLPGGWAQLPTVADELEAVKERHAEIEGVAPADANLIWCAGNHDSRFTSRLAQTAPDYIKVQGFDIVDHFPAWQFCWSIWLNENTVVKHRINQGVHGAYNNVLKSGKTIITGHTHRLQATMWADYNGLRWGVETGTLSDFGPENDKYAYAEDNPMNWSQGFVVLHFAPSGMLLEPEFCRVINGAAWFRGQPVPV